MRDDFAARQKRLLRLVGAFQKHGPARLTAGRRQVPIAKQLMGKTGERASLTGGRKGSQAGEVARFPETPTAFPTLSRALPFCSGNVSGTESETGRKPGKKTSRKQVKVKSRDSGPEKAKSN